MTAAEDKFKGSTFLGWRCQGHPIALTDVVARTAETFIICEF